MSLESEPVTHIQVENIGGKRKTRLKIIINQHVEKFDRTDVFDLNTAS